MESSFLDEMLNTEETPKDIEVEESVIIPTGYDSAFPCPQMIKKKYVQQQGISIRDYFAAKALASLISLYDEDEGWSADNIAGTAYTYADAMLKARS